MTVFYGAHVEQKKNGLSDNEKYLEEVKKILHKYKIKYEIKSSRDPDLDFLNMCHSDIFIQSGGGFSRLIVSYVKSNNKNVL